MTPCLTRLHPQAKHLQKVCAKVRILIRNAQAAVSLLMFFNCARAQAVQVPSCCACLKGVGQLYWYGISPGRTLCVEYASIPKYAVSRRRRCHELNAYGHREKLADIVKSSGNAGRIAVTSRCLAALPPPCRRKGGCHLEWYMAWHGLAGICG